MVRDVVDVFRFVILDFTHIKNYKIDVCKMPICVSVNYCYLIQYIFIVNATNIKNVFYVYSAMFELIFFFNLLRLQITRYFQSELLFTNIYFQELCPYKYSLTYIKHLWTWHFSYNRRSFQRTFYCVIFYWTNCRY